jgi:hypothetical protein
MALRGTTTYENVGTVGYAAGWRLGLEEVGVTWCCEPAEE